MEWYWWLIIGFVAGIIFTLIIMPLVCANTKAELEDFIDVLKKEIWKRNEEIKGLKKEVAEEKVKIQLLTIQMEKFL